MPYTDFLETKKRSAPVVGFATNKSDLPDKLFDWQKDAAMWAVERGRAALFEDCGLGKSAQSLTWAQSVVQHAGEVLYLAPLGVTAQTLKEAEKFGIDVPVRVARDESQVAEGGITITNYDRLNKFDTKRFKGVVLDESSILKSFSGVTKRALVEAFAHTPYKLPCSATPSPNDHMELGNHAEFLGVMPSNEMLARWFINDTASFGTYRLKRYAEEDFWDWVTTWAMCLSRPSDLTLNPADDFGYQLPQLIQELHLLDVDSTEGAEDGRLFRIGDSSATAVHREKRLTAKARLERSADLANATESPVIVWCEHNEESAKLAAMCRGAVEVVGSDSPDAKERKLAQFVDGTSRVLVTKPSIAGWGMNFQHCADVVFSSVTYSFESYYQAVRRSWRFGQERPVNVHLVAARTESGILDVLNRKRLEHEKMQTKMKAAMRRAREGSSGARGLRADAGFTPINVPAWLHA